MAIRDGVYLPAVISDYYGVSQRTAEEQIKFGIVRIDGQERNERGDAALWVERDQIEGKTIEVLGQNRTYNFEYQRRHLERREYRACCLLEAH